VAVCRKLNSISKPASQVLEEDCRAFQVSVPNKPRGNEFGIGTKSRKGPNVSISEFALFIFRDILFFSIGSAEKALFAFGDR